MAKIQKMLGKRKHTPDAVTSHVKELKMSMQRSLAMISDITQLPTFNAEKHLQYLPKIQPIEVGK